MVVEVTVACGQTVKSLVGRKFWDWSGVMKTVHKTYMAGKMNHVYIISSSI